MGSDLPARVMATGPVERLGRVDDHPCRRAGQMICCRGVHLRTPNYSPRRAEFETEPAR